ncbi:hypothetical protein GQ53DRAFT_823268 [Thozetella sp. PMI_491]|nr:hypothetical protein GQ53DRAFT_823268 [Thozetella sp. PMI_491]
MLFSGEKKKYHLYPDFDLYKCPGNTIQLGMILRNVYREGLSSPLNPGEVVPIDEKEISQISDITHGEGLSITVEKLRCGTQTIIAMLFGRVRKAWNRLLNMDTDPAMLTARALSTRTFEPTLEYAKEALTHYEVQSYFRRTENRHPVYLVSGILIAEAPVLSGGRHGPARVPSEMATTLLGFRVHKVVVKRDGSVKISEKATGAIL